MTTEREEGEPVLLGFEHSGPRRAFFLTAKGWPVGLTPENERSQGPLQLEVVALLARATVAMERIATSLERQGERIVASLPPEGLSKEDAARFIGVDVGTIEQLIRARRLEYVQTGSQRGRLIPVEALRTFLAEYRQKVLRLPARTGKE